MKIKHNGQEYEIDPLDQNTVEEVVARYAQKHIQHDRGGIIFVGSGGGKSTTCRSQTPDADCKTELVDADLVYRETGAHPLEPSINPARPLPWWDMGLDVIQEIEKRCGVVNESLVNHGLWALTTSFAPSDSYVPENIVIVLLAWEEHKQRIVEKFKSEHYDAGAQPTEKGFLLVRQHREWAEKVAGERNVAVVDSIDAAIEHFRSRER